ncbi:hypothetical protein ANOM_007884 [Aspergillus nomiae NRRL 13137]|uniref:Copper acquisition factor BIM1-like domain-containing protein n=1 Tax=Aspergillus nomiae NRRL (strain ATCC 15546 / NRRL 13137 / CBS 260.88 / M93) TaxID=1509407 RepID=A0A0L1IYE1_ASPN3|nr:uncharacterized protein ANOM_007884 [Aspergillus nomiae NRRL 13137]KNG84571.1 hypothetical protein ANOM_007884 [Aspergillus nomiae NRRL 13137]
MRTSQSSVSRWMAFLLLCLGLANAHTVIVYPGYRGNNLHTTGTVQEANGLGAAMSPNATNNNSLIYPYGQQWIYPCGGMPTTTNRTKWPVGGGAVSFQPGWFQGHATAFIYINLGLGTVPENMSHPMIPPFQINGPSNDPYPGTVCLPQVPLPANISVSPGDHATIQLVETAKHGAALYNCVDIEFAEPEDVAEVTRENCFNSSHISFSQIFAATSLTSGAVAQGATRGTFATLLATLVAAVMGAMMM